MESVLVSYEKDRYRMIICVTRRMGHWASGGIEVGSMVETMVVESLMYEILQITDC